VWDPHISNLEAGLPAEDLGANARATGEVLAVEQSSNNDKGDVENTIQVLAELKKQQREAPFRAPQVNGPVQYTVRSAVAFATSRCLSSSLGIRAPVRTCTAGAAVGSYFFAQ
jgi:hypothetical protein